MNLYQISYLPSFPYIYRSVCFKSLLCQYLVECDEVVLMKDGQIAEQGTHGQLMARGRDYAMLITSVQQEVQLATTLGEKHQGHLLMERFTLPFAQFMKHGLQSCCFRNVNSFLAFKFYERIDL